MCMCLHTQCTHRVLPIRACTLHIITRGPLSFICTITSLLLRFTSICFYLNRHHELATELFSITSYYLSDTSSSRSPYTVIHTNSFFIQSCTCCYYINLGLYCHSPTWVLSCLPTPYDSQGACTARRFSHLHLRDACTYHYRHGSAILVRRFNTLCYTSRRLSLCSIYVHYWHIVHSADYYCYQATSYYSWRGFRILYKYSYSLLRVSHPLTFHARWHRRAYTLPTHAVRHFEPFWTFCSILTFPRDTTAHRAVAIDMRCLASRLDIDTWVIPSHRDVLSMLSWFPCVRQHAIIIVALVNEICTSFADCNVTCILNRFDPAPDATHYLMYAINYHRAFVAHYVL